MQRDTIIWDVDGTLYPFSPDFDARCVTAAAAAARQLGYDGSQEEAEALARDGFDTHGNGLEVFCRGTSITLNDLHQLYHEHIDISEMPAYASLAHYMRHTAHTHAALTHGSSDWAKRVLAQRQLLSFFSPEHIVGMEHYDFQKKHESELPFATILARLGKDPQQCIMVEDSHRNLMIPHAMGIETVLVHRLLDEPVPYVNHQFSTPDLFMQALHRQHPSEPTHRLL